MVARNSPSPTAALKIAQTVFRARYEETSFAFAAGSIIRGEGRHLSDIDLVVIFNHVDAARRESFVVDGIPVEAFIHDRETLAWFIDDDVARGCPSILHMISEVAILGFHRSQAEALRRIVSARLSEGPPPLSTAALNALRYEITDAVNDLRGDRSFGDAMAIGAMLYPKLVELALRGRGQWNGVGKWAPRLLGDVDTVLANRFEDAFGTLFKDGNASSVIALANKELAPHGGRLFDGDCRAAPRSFRLA